MESEMRRRAQFAALGEAAAVIAHEIRNPLGIIKTSSEIVRMKSALRPSESRLIGFVLEEVARIDRLVQDILDYVRPTETKKNAIDVLRDVVARAVELVQPELQRHGISCAVADGGGTAPVFGDADQLHQAVLNLILNAIAAMPNGGRLTVDFAREDGFIDINIEDEGTGVDPRLGDRIFDPFVTTKTKGTGLGLAKTRDIVVEHAGNLFYKTKPGGGTIFTIRLPLLAREKPDAADDSHR
jgi:signal transduction histidine kinase